MGTQRMFLDKEFWFTWAREKGKLLDSIEIVDGYDIWRKTFGYDMAARFRYSVYLTKTAGACLASMQRGHRQ